MRGRITSILLVVASIACVNATGRSAIPADGAIPAGDHELALDVGDARRSYLLHIPPGLDRDRPVPLVLLFHGGFGDGRGQQSMSKMDPIADREGFVTVYPDGVGRAWNAGDCCGSPERRNVDDVRFVRALIDEIRTMLPIDPRRIYAAGMSNGAMLVHRLGCELSDTIAALAAVAGTIRVDECPVQRPVPIIVFHGTADRRIPWDGGYGQNRLTGAHTSVEDTVDGWRLRNGCSDESRIVGEHGKVVCESYGPCADGGAVVLCTVPGGGHQWPGGEPVWERKLGPMTTDVSASEEIWTFFEAHPMPS